MITLLIILFAFSLIYITVSERFRIYARLIGFQGILLFGLSFFSLKDISTWNLIFIFSETVLFKTIIIPILLYRIIHITGDSRVHKYAIPGYFAVFGAAILLLLSYLISLFLKTPVIDPVYFTISLFTLFTGILFVITHKKLYSHLIGFLIIENAVFLLSLAIGNEMPMLINTGILLDIFISVLILGTFLTKIGSQIHSMETENLTTLRD